MNNLELLKLLIPAIAWIDGGCSVCIPSFMDRANEALEQSGLPYRFVYHEENEEEQCIQIVNVERDGR